jgi:hypothetical protein
MHQHLAIQRRNRSNVMGVHPNDVWKELDYLDTELDRCKAKVANLRMLFAAVKMQKPAPPEFVCPQPHCGLGFTSSMRLGEHLENVHGVLPFTREKEQ